MERQIIHTKAIIKIFKPNIPAAGDGETPISFAAVDFKPCKEDSYMGLNMFLVPKIYKGWFLVF